MRKCMMLIMLLAALLLIPISVGANDAGVELAAREQDDEGFGSNLSDYDLSRWETYYANLPNEVGTLFSSGGIRSLADALLNGEMSFEEVWRGIGDIALSSLLNVLRRCAPILGASIAAAFAGILSGDGGVSEVAAYVFYGTGAVICGVQLADMVRLVTNTINSLVEFMELSSPVLSLAMTATGSVALGTAFQPLMLFLSGSMALFMKNIVLPLALFAGGFAIVNGLVENNGVTQIVKTMRSAIKWLVGAAFTVYSGVVIIQGLTLGQTQGLIFRTTRYTLDKSIPIVGSVVSGTLETVWSSTAMIKNVLGVAAIVVALAAVTAPLIKLATLSISNRFLGGLTGLIGDEKTPKLLGELAEIYNNLFAVLAVITVMFIITLGFAASAFKAV